MKQLKLINSLFFVAVFFSTTIVWSQALPPANVTLSPKSIRELSKSSGLTILEAAIRVHKAKENVYMSRTRLLPSVNLGMLIATVINPAFILQNVEYLLPFLLPSRWFDLAQAKHLSQAERVGFLTTELNIFASLDSLYYTVVSDLGAKDLLAEELKDTLVVENIVARSVEDGRASENDLNLAKSQTAMAYARLAKMEELIVEEVSELRNVLSLNLNTEISFDIVPSSISVLENHTIPQAAAAVLKVAPESQQIDFLLEAAASEKWSKVFSFISSSSIGSSSGGASSGFENASAFKNLEARGMFHFSFEMFPNINMTNHNINELKLRKKELESELGKLMENTLGRLKFLFSRRAELERAEALMKTVFTTDKKRYEIGELSLSDLVDSQGRLRQARLESVRVNTDLDLIRVTLHRMLVTDEFASIKGCEELPKSDKKPGWRWRWPWEDAPEDNICDPEAVGKRFGSGGPEEED